MKRTLRLVVGLSGLFTVVLAAALSWLLLSESGLRFAVARGVAMSPVPVEFETLQGRLLGDIRFGGLKVSMSEQTLRVANLDTTLSLGALIAGRVELEALRLHGVVVELHAAGQVEGPRQESPAWVFPEPGLPLDLRVTGINATDIRILETGPEGSTEAYVVQDLQLESLGFADASWSVKGMQMTATPMRMSGDLSYQTRAPHAIRVNLKNTLQLNENSLEIVTDIEGDEARLAIQQQLAGLAKGTISGEVFALADAPRWSMTGGLDLPEPYAIFEAAPQEPVSAALEFAGNMNSATASGELIIGQGPPVEFELTLADLADVAIGLDVRNLVLREQGGTASARFNGTVKMRGLYPELVGELAWTDMRWPLTVPATEAAGFSPSGTFAVEGEAGKYRLDGRVELAAGETVGAFLAQGDVDLAAEPASFSLRGGWDTLPLRAGTRDVELAAGQYQAKGNLDAYQFTAGFTASTDGSPRVVVNLSGGGDSSAVAVTRLGLDSTAGRIFAEGRMALTGERSFELVLTADAVNPGAFDSRWPGLLALQGKASGKFASDGIAADVRIQELKGRLRDQSLAAQGSVTLAGGSVAAADVSGKWGESQLQARGTLKGRRDFSWQLRVPDLANHTDRGTGSLSSEGQLKGTATEPDIQVRISARDFRYVDTRIAELDLDAHLAGQEGAASSLQATAQGLVWNDQLIESLVAKVDGSEGDHSGSVRVTRAKESLQANFTGRWAAGSWRGQLQSTDLRLGDSQWQQDEPAALVVDETHLQLATTCFVHEQSRVCLASDYAWQAAPQFELAVQALPLAEIGALLPGGLSYSGNVSANARLEGAQGSASFTLSDARVWQDIAGDQQVLLDYSEMTGKASLDGARLAVDLQGNEPGERNLNAAFSVPYTNWAVGTGSVDGRVQGVIENLGALAVLFPDLADLHGRLEADMRLSGTVAAPMWDGDILLIDGNAQLPTLGLKLVDINGRLTASGRTLRGELSVRSGPGSLSISGEGTSGLERANARLQLRGERFLASDLPEARLILSPDLVIGLDGRAIRLDGSVNVDEANIEPRDLSAAVQASPDARVIAPTGSPAEEDGWTITSKVIVSFSDKVFFEGFGLRSRISGALTVEDAPDTVTTATGELAILDGTYEAYGRALEIRRGRLLFSGGPLSNPGLDIMATRKEESAIEVGVLVRATLKAPEISLYSDPAMAPSQTLSYLLVGQPLSEIGSADKQLLSDTATRLASAGGGLLAQQLGRRLGLEDVRVSSGPTGDQAALVIGTYLSPKLYASYGVGLFEPVNTLRLRYMLSSRWTVRAESGTEQSADIEFTLER